MKQVSITKAVRIKNQRVKPFDGEKEYLATGGLVENKIIPEMVTYKTKPSRADLLVTENQLIVARMKATTKVFLINKNTSDLIVSTGFLVFDVQEGWHPKFLFHYFTSSFFQEQKDRLSIGATQKAINNTKLEEIFIPELSFKDQKRIVKILDKADALRQKRKQAIDLLDDYLKSVFLDMFGDENNSVMVKLYSLANKTKGSMRTGPFGSDLKHSEFVGKGIAVLGIDNAVKNKFEWAERRFVTNEKYQKLKRYTVFPSDIIITIMGTLGRSAIIPEDIPLAINTKHLATITLNEKKANPYFIAYSIHSDIRVKRQIISKSRGAIMSGLNLGIIKNLELVEQPIALQNKFETIYREVETTKQKMLSQSEELETQFQALMQKAFKGELIEKNKKTNNEYIETLKLFHQCVEELRTNTRIFGNFKVGIGYNFKPRNIEKMDIRDIKEFMMNFRPFISKKEDIYFYKIYNLIYKNTSNNQILDNIKQLRVTWVKNSKSGSSQKIYENKKEISPEENMDIWFNAEFFHHSDKDKTTKLEKLKSGPFGGFSFILLIDSLRMAFKILDDLDKLIVKEILKDIV